MKDYRPNIQLVELPSNNLENWSKFARKTQMNITLSVCPEVNRVISTASLVPDLLDKPFAVLIDNDNSGISSNFHRA